MLASFAARLGSALSMVSGFASAGAFLVRALLGAPLATRAWLVPWLGFSSLLLPSALLTGIWTEAGGYVLGAALLAGAALLIRVRRREAIQGLVTVSLLLAAAALLQPWATSRTWQPYPEATVRVAGVGTRGLVNRVEVERGGPAGFRSYRVSSTGDGFTVTLDARAVRLPRGMPSDAEGAPPAHTAATVEVQWLGTFAGKGDGSDDIARIRFTPPDTWTHYTFPIRAPTHRDATALLDATAIVRLYVREGVVVDTRDLRLESASGAGEPPRAVMGPTRASLHMGAPNLLGHSAAAGALALLALTSSQRGSRRLLRWIGLACFCVLIWRSGSRSAWLGLGFGGMLLVLDWMRHNRERGYVPLLTLAVAAMGAGTTWLARQPGLESQPDRWSIFVRAGEAILTHPWTGIATAYGSFEGWWVALASPATESTVHHAHNLWLHLGAMYGLPGMAAALWLTTAYVLVARRLAAGRGVALAGGLLAMNLFDLSFFVFSVQFPLLLALGADPPLSMRSVAPVEDDNHIPKSHDSGDG